MLVWLPAYLHFLNRARSPRKVPLALNNREVHYEVRSHKPKVPLVKPVKPQIWLNS